MSDDPSPPNPIAALAQREIERRTPFGARLWTAALASSSAGAEERPATEGIGPEPMEAARAGEQSRHEVAGRLPFFLRKWWLRDWREGEDLKPLGADLHTLPLGSQYSDPLCDVGSSDIMAF